MHTQWPMTAGWLDVVALNRPRIVHIQQSTRIVSRARAPSTSTQTVKLVQYNTLNGIYSTPISSSALHTHTHTVYCLHLLCMFTMLLAKQVHCFVLAFCCCRSPLLLPSYGCWSGYYECSLIKIVPVVGYRVPVTCLFSLHLLPLLPPPPRNHLMDK